MFRQGQLDFTNDIEASFKDEVLTKKGELRKDWEGKIRLTQTFLPQYGVPRHPGRQQ